MQVESEIPPLQIRLNHMKQRAAAQLAVRIDPRQILSMDDYRSNYEEGTTDVPPRPDPSL